MKVNKYKFFTYIYLFFIGAFLGSAQVAINEPLSEKISIRQQAKILPLVDEEYDFAYVKANYAKLPFVPMNNLQENIGFSDDAFYIQFSLENNTKNTISYYLETARPITDEVTLYLSDSQGIMQTQYSGDVIPFSDKTIAHRKSIFNITMEPGQQLDAFIHLKSDGEVVMLPLDIYSKDTFLYLTYKEQVFYGFFYGILILACIVYLFFYFGLKDMSFVYYALYVFFIAMLQFSLDGFFHQYITPSGGWISDRAVLIGALISMYFFGRYGDTFFALKEHSKFLHKSFRAVGALVLAALLGILFIPSFLVYCYPLANLIGLVILVQMISAITLLKTRKVPVDNSFILGIFFLVTGFIVFILNNLNIIQNSFFTDNGAKVGIGLEIIFLSISMSNRIRDLRLENDRNHQLALQRSEDMNAIKSSFISNISHELRTPLNLIMGVASSLRGNRKEDNLDEKLKLILNSSESLLGYVEDILDFTVIEKGNQELKETPFNLNSTLDKILVLYRKKAENKKLVFEYSQSEGMPKRIIGDKSKLVQIINNLLDNAIKFTEFGKIGLKITHKYQKNGKLALDIIVSDTGVGISEEKMSTIFESFTKKSFLDKREFSGLGLGLYIVKSYVDLQKGTIQLRNNPNHGISCTVNLEFEYDEDELQVEQKGITSEHDFDLGGKRLLLVEDNKMNQTVVKLLVKKWKNTTLVIANNGEEAIEKLNKESFDLILMDLQMPIMDGFETTTHIRSGKVACLPGIPIIVLTADSTSKTRKEIFRIGVHDYMTKPIKGNVLYQKIKKNLVPA